MEKPMTIQFKAIFLTMVFILPLNTFAAPKPNQSMMPADGVYCNKAGQESMIQRESFKQPILFKQANQFCWQLRTNFQNKLGGTGRYIETYIQPPKKNLAGLHTPTTSHDIGVFSYLVDKKNNKINIKMVDVSDKSTLSMSLQSGHLIGFGQEVDHVHSTEPFSGVFSLYRVRKLPQTFDQQYDHIYKKTHPSA